MTKTKFVTIVVLLVLAALTTTSYKHSPTSQGSSFINLVEPLDQVSTEDYMRRRRGM